MTLPRQHARFPDKTTALPPRELVAFVIAAAADSALLARLDLDPVKRTWIRLRGPGNSEAWLIGWPPGSGTGWHDHGGATGAFAVARGCLDELTPPTTSTGRATATFAPGTEVRVRLSAHSARSLPDRHIHDVRNTSTEHAISIHVYSPALSRMNRYVHEGGRLTVHAVESADDW